MPQWSRFQTCYCELFAKQGRAGKVPDCRRATSLRGGSCGGTSSLRVLCFPEGAATTRGTKAMAMAAEKRETSSLIGSDKVEGTNVYRSNGDNIGSIERIMIDKLSGKVAYAVMSFGGRSEERR